jgi:hypothetical protein
VGVRLKPQAWSSFMKMTEVSGCASEKALRKNQKNNAPPSAPILVRLNRG